MVMAGREALLALTLPHRTNPLLPAPTSLHLSPPHACARRYGPAYYEWARDVPRFFPAPADLLARGRRQRHGRR